MGWYTQGTVSVSNGSTAVTGTLTGWTNQALPEDAISFDGGASWYEIAAVNSNTSITLTSPYLGTSITNGNYKIQRLGRGHGQVSYLSQQVAALLERFPALGGVLDAGKLLKVAASGLAFDLTSTVVREGLTGNRTYYVRPADGNDANNGLANTAGGAFATLGKALQAAASVDCRGLWNVSIQLADGTYNGTNILPVMVGQLSNAPTLYIQGNGAAPANVILNNAAGYAVVGADLQGRVRLQDLTITAATLSNIYAIGPGTVEIANVRHGATGGAHLDAQFGAIIRAAGNCQTVGNALYHYSAAYKGMIEVSSYEDRYFGSLTFTATARAADGLIRAESATQVLNAGASVTGQRFTGSLNGTIITGTADANFFPGNSAGATGTGAQYF